MENNIVNIVIKMPFTYYLLVGRFFWAALSCILLVSLGGCQEEGNTGGQLAVPKNSDRLNEKNAVNKSRSVPLLPTFENHAGKALKPSETEKINNLALDILNKGAAQLELEMSKIKSFGTEYFMAVVKPLKFDESHMFQAVLLWDLNFQLVGKMILDNRDASAALDQLRIGTFGEKDAWFAWYVRYAPTNDFQSITEIFALKKGMPLALKVYHQINDQAYTWSNEQAVDGAFVSFTGESNLMSYEDRGVAKDGKLYRPRIKWVPAKEQFEGPSGIVFNGKKIYEVDLKSSTEFIAIDK